MKPKRLTMEEFEDMIERTSTWKEFHEYHGLPVPEHTNWSKILSEEWLNGDHNEPEDRIKYYNSWYTQRFTKLGKVLK